MTDHRARPSRWAPWTLAGVFLILASWFFPYFPSLGSPNELTRLYLTRAMVDDASFAIDGPVSRYGRITDLAKTSKHLYSDKAPGVSLAGVPVYLALKTLSGGEAQAVSNARLLRWLRFFLSSLPTAGIALLLFFLLLRMGVAREAGLFLMAAYSFASIAFPYGVLLFGHQLAALCLMGALTLILSLHRQDSKSAPFWAGCLLACALLTEYTTLLAVAPLAIYSLITFRRKIQVLLLASAGALLPITVLATYHAICFGGPLSTGYSHLAHASFAAVHNQGWWGMVTPSFDRLFQILFSPSRGLFFFSPWLLLAIPGLAIGIRRPPPSVPVGAWTALLVASILYWLFAMSLQLSAWGWSLGPRHLAPMIPFWVLAIGALLRYRPIWARWTARSLLVLVPYSILAIVLPTASFGGFPPDFSNPLADFTLPLLLDLCLAPNIGTNLGWSPLAAALPFFLTLLGLLNWIAWIWWGPSRSKPLLLALAIALTLTVFTAAGPPVKQEDRALTWAREKILDCPPPSDGFSRSARP